MTFKPGDIVRFQSPTAGKLKYHLCIMTGTEQKASAFLFINSRPGYNGDFVLNDGAIPNLPKSPTGKSVISCSQLVRLRQDQLTLYRADKIGKITISVARKLHIFIEDVPTLTENERLIVLDGLSKI